MTGMRFRNFVEKVKRPVRNMAFKLGIKHEPTNEELVARLGPVVSYHGNLFDIGHERCNPLIGGSIVKGSYERMEIQMIREFIRPDDRVIELGACMGVTSLVLFDLVGRANHLVVEADRRNLAMAKHMFDLNKKDVRMKFGMLAAGENARSEIPFASNENASSSSQYTRKGSEVADKVPALQFEDVIEEERATAMVLDIEGGEYDLFTRATSFGSLCRIILEAHPDILGGDKMADMIVALEGHGFDMIRNHDSSRFLILER